MSSGPVGIYSEGAGSNVLSITASSSGKTAAFNLASFTNLATSTTASIIKSGLSITSTGAWTGINAKNIGLYIPSVTGGTSNYGIYDLSGANDYFSGNVGIGTTTPWGILSVGAPVAGSQSPLFVVASSTPTATTTVFIINASNNVGIGTTTPYSRLEVCGPDAASSTPAFAVVNTASTTVFAVFDGGNAQLCGTLTQNSDQRLKTNIQALDGSSSLAEINALNPVTFNWIDPNKTPDPSSASSPSKSKASFRTSSRRPRRPRSRPTARSASTTSTSSPRSSPRSRSLIKRSHRSLRPSQDFAQSITSAVGNFGISNAAE